MAKLKINIYKISKKCLPHMKHLITVLPGYFRYLFSHTASLKHISKRLKHLFFISFSCCRQHTLTAGFPSEISHIYQLMSVIIYFVLVLQDFLVTEKHHLVLPNFKLRKMENDKFVHFFIQSKNI